MTTQEERRDDNCQERQDDNYRRVVSDRRQNGSSMISNYSNYSGPERRSNLNRRSVTERRTIAS